MGFRFFRRVKILPGMYVNFGKRGASLSFGPRGAKVNIGKNGVRSSVGIPGTDIRYEKKLVGFGSHGKSPAPITGMSGTKYSPTKQNLIQQYSGANHRSETVHPIPPEIDAILAACHEALVQNTILNTSLIFLNCALLLASISAICKHLPGTALYGFAFVLITAFTLRIVIRLSSKISIKGLYNPGRGDSFAQIMRIAFKSEDVRYSTVRLVGTKRATCTSHLPFPLSKLPGAVSFNFGRLKLVPITNYVLFFRGTSVCAVPEEIIAMELQSASRTVSTGSNIPSDAYITGQSWLHMTVKGQPDRRYSYNPGETTYQIGVIRISANGNFSINVAFSHWSLYNTINDMLSKRGHGYVTYTQQKVFQSHSKQMPKGSSGDYTSLVEAASKNLVDYVGELSRNRRCVEVLNNAGGIESADKFAEHCQFNPRFAMLLYGDALAVFRDLDCSTDNLKGLEGLGFLFLLGNLFKLSINTAQIRDPSYSAQLAPIVSKFVRNLGFSASAEGRNERLLLHLVLNQNSGDHVCAVKYATLMYRWASAIAKADGTITAKESKCLSDLMELKDASDGCNVRVSGNGSDNGKDAVRRDFANDVHKPKSGLNDVMKELDNLVGLASVKNEVRQLTSFIEIQLKRKARGLKVAPITYHCVFTGNPGTGKTTVARILAEIYREMGVVKKGHLVETDRSGLVAEYVGQTAVKTNKIIDSALDGVLFIDEAYSLVQGGEKDYGREAISTLLKRMEDDRDRLVVILAGYTDEMKAFIDSNPGLQSRFNRYVEFPDYNADELAKIFLMYTEKNQYTCDGYVRASIVDVMKLAVENKDRNFGNARYVRNLFEKAIQRQAVRLSSVAPITTEMLAELTLHDLGFSYED